MEISSHFYFYCDLIMSTQINRTNDKKTKTRKLSSDEIHEFRRDFLHFRQTFSKFHWLRVSICNFSCNIRYFDVHLRNKKKSKLEISFLHKKSRNKKYIEKNSCDDFPFFLWKFYAVLFFFIVWRKSAAVRWERKVWEEKQDEGKFYI